VGLRNFHRGFAKSLNVTVNKGNTGKKAPDLDGKPLRKCEVLLEVLPTFDRDLEKVKVPAK
jgi:hypothetical protein